jgi:hypothetical protein
MVCSICKTLGHNKRTCNQVIKPVFGNYFLSSNVHTHIKRSRGGNSLKNGISYEKNILQTLCSMNYRNQPITSLGNTGGSTRSPDIQLMIDGKTICIEIKNKGGFEGGGKHMKIINDHLVCPDRSSIHSSILESYSPFQGRIPSFMNGNKSIETWQNEKHDFRDEYINVNTDIISNYYYYYQYACLLLVTQNSC